MAQSRRSKKIFNFLYGMGAAVVIIGALFKLVHFSIGPLTGNVMLTIGLIVEAFVFAVSAFDSVDADLDWSLVYPELSEKQDDDKRDARESQSLLTQKLDNMLKDAKLDANLMQSLSGSIKNFKDAAENIAPAVDSIAATNKYSEQLSLAATKMETLNSSYLLQAENATRQAELNNQTIENAEKLRSEMESLVKNLNSLNDVYGGMLNAMASNK